MYQRHPLSAAFPIMDNDRLKELAESIKRSGLREPIYIYQGMIVDGWNRYTACQMAGIEPDMFVNMPDDYPDIENWVLDLNLFRRHLSDQQRAVSVVSVYNLKEGVTAQEMAELANVSVTTIERAKKAVRKGEGEAIINGEKKFDRTNEVRRRSGEHTDPRVRSPEPGLEEKYNKAMVEIKALTERNDTLQQHAELLLTENEQMRKILDADDKLAQALKEINLLNEKIALRDSHIVGLQNTANQAIKQAKKVNKDGNNH